MAIAISGFRGRVMIQPAVATVPPTDPIALLATKWSVTYKTELQDASSFEETTGGLLGANTPISRYVQSMSDLEFNVDAYYDAVNGIVPLLKPGAFVTLELFTNKGADKGTVATNQFLDPDNQWAGAGATRKFMFNAFIENLTVDTEVRGVIKYTLAGKVSSGNGIVLA